MREEGFNHERVKKIWMNQLSYKAFDDKYYDFLAIVINSTISIMIESWRRIDATK